MKFAVTLGGIVEMTDIKFTWLILFLIVTIGCERYEGPRRGAVHGEVTLDGVPIKEGTIVFTPTGGNKGSVAGGSIQDGQYAIDEPSGPVVGLNMIAISAFKKTGRKFAEPPPSPPGTMTDETVEAVPPRYNVNSELTSDIVSGDNELNFELESN